MFDWAKALGGAVPETKTPGASSPTDKKDGWSIIQAAHKQQQESRTAERGSQPDGWGLIEKSLDDGKHPKELAQNRAAYEVEHGVSPNDSTSSSASRMRNMGIDDSAMPKRTVTYEMTQKDYDALDDKQRSAVDFNTMLAGAVKTDRDSQDQYSKTAGKQAHATYNVASEEIFGKDRGSDLYAPETVAFLRQLDLPAMDSASLDDFLNLKVAVTDDDLSKLGMNKNPRDKAEMSNMQPLIKDRAVFQASLAQDTQGLQQKLAEGNRLMQDFAKSATIDRSEDRTLFGGVAPNVTQDIGFGKDKLDELFQRGYRALASTDGSGKRDINEVFQAVNSGGGLVDPLTKDQQQAFVNYLDTKSRSAMDYQSPLVDEKDRSAEEKKLSPLVLDPADFRGLMGFGDK